MIRTARSMLVIAAIGVALAASGTLGPAASAVSSSVSSADPFRTELVARAARPTAWALHPDGTGYVAEQAGTVRAVPGPGAARVLGPVALDLSSKVSGGPEQGLLGIAFSPDGTMLYSNRTDPRGDTRIEEHPFAGGRADTSRTRLLLHIPQPYSNHNGGQLVVTDDGVLWIGVGDGGSSGDPEGHAQNRQSLLGKILRIDPSRPGAARPYGIPPGNLPDGAGRPEIWAFGLRNPWRFSLDEPTGTVWIADVGQNAWEEVNAVPATAAGLDFGWNRREGRHPFRRGGAVAGATEPVWDYRHERGRCSVSGGVVVRDPRLPALLGRYLAADWCSGELWSLQRSAMTGRSAPKVTVRRLQTRIGHPVGFGVAADGSVVVLSSDGPVLRLVPR